MNVMLSMSIAASISFGFLDIFLNGGGWQIREKSLENVIA